MKKATYISASIGFLFLIISLIAFLTDLNFYNLFLPLGIGILLLISLPLLLTQLSDQSKKMRNDTKTKQQQVPKKPRKGSVKKPGKKSTHDYPSFGGRKSGLKWGGGNIHASTAKRGSKRGFLER